MQRAGERKVRAAQLPCRAPWITQKTTPRKRHYLEIIQQSSWRLICGTFANRPDAETTRSGSRCTALDAARRRGLCTLQNGSGESHHVEVSPAKSPDAGGAGQVHLPEKVSEKPLTTSGVSGIIESKLPVKDAQLKHMFGNRKGHLPDTPENRRTIEGVANSKSYYLGRDANECDWYAKTTDDGKQIWVKVHDGTISNCGQNDALASWDPQTGLDKNPIMTVTWRKKRK